MTRLFFIGLVLLLSNSASAQEFKYGFKTGLNFNNIKGEAEKDANGNELETFTNNTGFHIGATFAWNATDLMGLRAEFLYSQKGTNREFEGPSYYSFYTLDNEEIRTTGTRKQVLNVSNSYLEIPVMGYIKPVKWLEVYGGGSLGFLVASTAFGNINYSDGMTPTGAVVGEITHELDFNYFSDEARQVSYDNPPTTVKIQGDDVPYPQTAGAYFEFLEDRGNLYKIVDVGLIGGLSIYFNK
ncbi:MAG: outer membrane beta-barrel protein, partial [Bacteroidetes bacterium]|nr:outer membrane beta-barrel protein [Bacteroidota bacterium]